MPAPQTPKAKQAKRWLRPEAIALIPAEGSTQKFWVVFAAGSTPLSAKRKSRPSAKVEVGMSLMK